MLELQCSVIRSMTIARMTIAMPASNAAPTFVFSSARMIGTPSPGAPMRTVTTTIPRASMIVWLTPSAITRRASGSWTLRSVWQRVAPSESAASTVVPGTPRIASEVIRIAAGIA